jgi:hypothetical protein
MRFWNLPCPNCTRLYWLSRSQGMSRACAARTRLLVEGPSARRWAPRFPNLRAITFEFHESYFGRLGVDGITAELEAMHALADTCVRVPA